MGRKSTGAVSTIACARIEINYLRKKGYLIEGCKTSGVLSWSGGEHTNIVSYWGKDEIYIELSYSVAGSAGNTIEHKHKIQIIGLPSSLGCGQILYLVCPVTGLRCKVLYRGYGSQIWQGRLAYDRRIYYPIQLSSKINSYGDNYNLLSGKIDALKQLRQTDTYNGKKTRRAIRLDKLQEKQFDVSIDLDSCKAMPKKLWAFALEMKYILRYPQSM